MTRTYNVIDADGHILEPLDLWDNYMDPKFRDRAPRLVIDPETGKEKLDVEGQLLGSQQGMGGIGGVGARQGAVKSAEMKYEEGRPGGFDPPFDIHPRRDPAYMPVADGSRRSVVHRERLGGGLPVGVVDHHQRQEKVVPPVREAQDAEGRDRRSGQRQDDAGERPEVTGALNQITLIEVIGTNPNADKVLHEFALDVDIVIHACQ